MVYDSMFEVGEVGMEGEGDERECEEFEGEGEMD